MESAPFDAKKLVNLAKIVYKNEELLFTYRVKIGFTQKRMDEGLCAE